MMPVAAIAPALTGSAGRAEAKLERKNRTADPMAPTEMNFTP